MAYVLITKDLTEVKDKVAFGLTKRQIICFSLGGFLGAGSYFLTRDILGNDLALLLLIILAAPFMLFGMYEKNGQPLEKILRNRIRVRFLVPAVRIYRTDNHFAALERKARYEKEVEDIEFIPKKAAGKSRSRMGTSGYSTGHKTDTRRQKTVGKSSSAGKERR